MDAAIIVMGLVVMVAQVLAALDVQLDVVRLVVLLAGLTVREVVMDVQAAALHHVEDAALVAADVPQLVIRLVLYHVALLAQGIAVMGAKDVEDAVVLVEDVPAVAAHVPETARLIAAEPVMGRVVADV